ncbi:glycosyl hydrolase family 95 catalytic domain-containing protein [Saliterribacillus persicus]|uniref:Glycosyl hydrolase family 65 n=1 Tax=Saliterribacillus persicus TaxID=930114 RepID=A0A368Y615_9BACI|nr:glycoside hydrolase N-terminal domain-containing protein [Saliterribacillus persicus]RCW74776.1 glycosyl hydrolase family 65 [Saliterribacillus persicus]
MEHNLPERGVWTKAPAKAWEDASVTANGVQGVMVFGNPKEDIIVGNHCRLFLPYGNKFEAPALAPYIDETRKIIKQKSYQEALAFQYEKATELGYQGLTMSDPTHPGFHLHIKSDIDSYKHYKRSINYQTGEITVSFDSNKYSYYRKTFVSRKDDVIVHQLTTSAPEHTYTLLLEHYEVPQLKQIVKKIGRKIEAQYDYVHSEGGYDVSISLKGENLEVNKNEETNEVYLKCSHPILIIMQIKPYATVKDRELSASSFKETTTYSELFLNHLPHHEALFNRVTLDLVDQSKRLASLDDILIKAKKSKEVPPEWLEKMYDAGRFMYICSAGELTPNLQGIWTGTFHPAWSGDFTFDTNVQLSIASALSSNLSEGLHGFFRLIKELMPGFRENARKYYGCRGIMSSAHSSNSGVHVHWNEEWPLHLWTCGAGWLGHWYYQYYRFTGDLNFLETEAIPYLEEVVLFYEDFLIEDADGTYRFTPSYSAENGCGDNATQDIAVLKEVLMNLIKAYHMLETSTEKISKMQRMLDKLPDYMINEDGALKEWLTKEKGENYNHRHFSHLYPVFQSREFNEETNPKMWEAARMAFKKRREAWLLSEDGNTTSTHGRMHAALCATQFHMPDLIEEVFTLLLLNDCFYSSLMMSHYNNREVFNVDGNGALPQVVHEMLIDYSNQRLTLLGALPHIFPKGNLQGVQLVDQLEVEELSWNLPEKQLVVRLKAKQAQHFSVHLPLFKKARLEISSKEITNSKVILEKQEQLLLIYKLEE